MKPTPDEKCEACGTGDLSILFDGRVKRTEVWPKGHWVFLCPRCHFLYGLGYGYDDLVIYEKTYQGYKEVIKRFYMDSNTLTQAIRSFAAKCDPNDEAQVVLLGEIGVQLALLVRGQAETNGHLQRIGNELNRANNLQVSLFGGNDVNT